MEAFPRNVVEIMDKESVLLVLQVTLGMVSLGNSSSEITAGFPGFMQGPVNLCWRRSLQIFVDIVKQALTNNKVVTGRELIHAPYIIAQSNSSPPPIVIHETDLSGPTHERIVSTAIVSFMRTDKGLVYIGLFLRRTICRT